MNRKYFDCACYSQDHTICLEYIDDDPDDSIVTLSVQLTKYRAWYKRLWAAIKYVFGYQSRYGHWDCFIIEPGQNLDDIIWFLTEARNATTKKD